MRAVRGESALPAACEKWNCADGSIKIDGHVVEQV